MSTTAVGTPLLVLHDTGDPEGGGRWTGLADAWDGEVLAPDLPGHGSAAPPAGGAYQPSDGALEGMRLLRARDLWDAEPVAVGHGWGGFSAEFLAAAGKVRSLVLVDGLGGPWLDSVAIYDQSRAWVRGVLDDPEALAAPVAVPDPRLRHGFPSMWQRQFTEDRRGAITCPVLAIETPASPTPPDERDARIAAFAGEARWVAADEASAEAVAPHLAAL